jgi:hypothetical protein
VTLRFHGEPSSENTPLLLDQAHNVKSLWPHPLLRIAWVYVRLCTYPASGHMFPGK